MNPNALRNLFAAFALAAALCAGQSEPRVVSLSIEHNGKVSHAPRMIRITYDGHSADMEVVDSRFAAPAAVSRSEYIALSFTLGRTKVHCSDIPGGKLEEEYWKIILADRRYESQYQNLLPQGVPAKSACVIVFSSKETEATFVLDPHCRK